ncbi:MAG: class I SAM-dependent methyltransferase [Planctomycetota bacterium]
MTDGSRWDERYRTGDLPWDTQRHDKHLERVLAEHSVEPCAALEIGAGTGSNAIWLAQQGFRVTALDLSSVAVDAARKKASRAGVGVEFVAADILTDAIPNTPFGFAFDRGCFHSFAEPGDRAAYAQAVADCLAEGGLWFSLIGNADGPDRETGPPRRSVRDIADVVEPLFEILSLEAAHFDSDQPEPAPAWACLMRKRTRPARTE